MTDDVQLLFDRLYESSDYMSRLAKEASHLVSPESLVSSRSEDELVKALSQYAVIINDISDIQFKLQLLISTVNKYTDANEKEIPLYSTEPSHMENYNIMLIKRQSTNKLLLRMKDDINTSYSTVEDIRIRAQFNNVSIKSMYSSLIKSKNDGRYNGEGLIKLEINQLADDVALLNDSVIRESDIKKLTSSIERN